MKGITNFINESNSINESNKYGKPEVLISIATDGSVGGATELVFGKPFSIALDEDEENFIDNDIIEQASKIAKDAGYKIDLNNYDWYDNEPELMHDEDAKFYLVYQPKSYGGNKGLTAELWPEDSVFIVL